MSKAIAGFFKTRSEGEAAQAALLSNGFLRAEVGFLGGASGAHETPAIGPVLRHGGSQSEATRDTWMGAVVGSVAGLGLLVAAGPLVGIFAGLAVGGAVGGLFGLIKDYGISEEEAAFYAKGVLDDGSLVTVHGVTQARAQQARTILRHNGAIRVEGLTDEPSEQVAEGVVDSEAKSYNICGEDVSSTH